MPTDCPQLLRNQGRCTCTYEPCSRKGRCCECVQYHLARRQIPGCFFPADVEATYDRTFERFARAVIGRAARPR